MTSQITPQEEGTIKGLLQRIVCDCGHVFWSYDTPQAGMVEESIGDLLTHSCSTLEIRAVVRFSHDHPKSCQDDADPSSSDPGPEVEA